MSNVLFIDKPKGITSFDVCYKLRKVLNTKKIGHTGTLDPNATGVMIVLYDSATKANQFLVTDTKEYIATVKIGIETDTLDIDGEIISQMFQTMPLKEEIENTLSKYLGKTKQLPPMTSAIKVNGKKLYEYQYKNQEVEIPLRDIEIFEIELLDINEQTFTFRTVVSSGTYIRALVRDVLKDLNIIGTTLDLRRTKVDNISIDNCDKLEDILNGEYHVHDLTEILQSKYHTIILKDPTLAIHGRRMRFNTDAENVLIVSDNKAIAMYGKDGDEYKCIRGLQ